MESNIAILKTPNLTDWRSRGATCADIYTACKAIATGQREESNLFAIVRSYPQVDQPHTQRGVDAPVRDLGTALREVLAMRRAYHPAPMGWAVVEGGASHD